MPPKKEIDNRIYSVEDALKLINNMTVVSHDNSIVCARCIKDHLHDYYVSDIVKNNGLKCHTCDNETKLARPIRMAAEALFMRPFILIGRNTYSNTELGIVLYGNKLGNKCVTGDGLEISIKFSTDIERITTYLRRCISNYSKFPPALRDKIYGLDVVMPAPHILTRKLPVCAEMAKRLCGNVEISNDVYFQNITMHCPIK